MGNEATRFPYQPANKMGRPIGSRAKLSEAFLKDLHDLWIDQGRSILEAALAESPGTVLKIFASVLPKEERRTFVFSLADTLMQAEERLKLRKEIDGRSLTPPAN